MGTEGANAADSVRSQRHQPGLGTRGRGCASAGNAGRTFWADTKTPTASTPNSNVLSNATYANDASELVKVIREQFKLGADFIKIYETRQGRGRRRSPFHAISIHRGRTTRRRHRGSACAQASRGARYGRTRHALRGARGCRLHRPRRRAERRDDEADARAGDLRRADVPRFRSTSPRNRRPVHAPVNWPSCTPWSSANNSRRECRSRWAPTSDLSRTARRPRSLSGW